MGRRRGSFFWGILFVVLGCVWLWNNLDIGPRIDVGSLWPLLLIGMGIYIVLRQTGVVGGWSEQSVNIDRILGDVRLGGPGWQAQNKNIFSIIGDVDIDLRQSIIPEGETVIKMRSIIGDVDIIVPQDVAVFAGASVTIGELRVMTERRDGFLLDVTYSTPDYVTATRKLRIEVEMLIGDATIMRAS
jgi:lia operon protein LiaF